MIRTVRVWSERQWAGAQSLLHTRVKRVALALNMIYQWQLLQRFTVVKLYNGKRREDSQWQLLQNSQWSSYTVREKSQGKFAADDCTTTGIVNREKLQLRLTKWQLNCCPLYKHQEYTKSKSRNETSKSCRANDSDSSSLLVWEGNELVLRADNIQKVRRWREP